ncbi:hypothetical protein LCGC14_2592750 [marine sediment metagenome]|uniref:Uncharacterized protein n=1 Tax=marine sediment metagenome TaxID=412755 RepID=A0A0F9ABG0_9ZZZZ
MKTLLLIPILLLTGCMALNKPLYDRQPEIVKVDARMKTVNKQLGFLDMIGADLDLVAARRHIDLIGVFYSAFEVAFADGDAEKFQSMINRINTQVDALEDLIAEAKPIPLPKEIL